MSRAAFSLHRLHATCYPVPSLTTFQLDLEELRPQLAGHEQPVVLRIERDSVENALGIINAVDGRQQPR
jgi:hypothetical protein